ncbi:MAG: GIY-YIG nuclease family protein [Planctomycetota bacterium]
MDSGIYIAVFVLNADRRMRVGALGRVRLRAGVYFYVGSALRNLSARLERHGRKDKPLHWHIDYLARAATMLGAVVVPGMRRTECALAAELGALFKRPVPGFGASDCRCGGHLFYSPGFLRPPGVTPRT